MPHQRAIIESYMADALEKPDVALQLPTGSGKTLVGVMIGEWRRRKLNEKVVYLCPTRQLVHQTAEQCANKFGLDVVKFVGQKSKYSPIDAAQYRQGKKIAITTYNSLFNTNPFFNDADTIIVDDAHTADNYISSMWSLEVDSREKSHRPLIRAIASILKPHIGKLDYSILCGDISSFADVGWVDKIPTPVMLAVKDDLIEVIDENVEEIGLHFSWKMIRENLNSCHIYIGFGGLLMRPIIPPTWSFPAFENAKHRLFMSATPGEGGDLERLTGREKIYRLPAPVGFDLEAVGRRFFMFPGMSLDAEEIDELRLKLMERAGRSVVLTPSGKVAKKIEEAVEDGLGYSVFGSDELEHSKGDFVNQEKAVAILAGRYDGIDFPKKECRLLFIEELPKAANYQERFFQKKMGAELLLSSRIQTRVLQAIGRCTRSIEDYSVVVVSGGELQDYLSAVDRREFLYPEFQAEIEFGVEESIDVEQEEFLAKFDAFWEHDDDGLWGEIEDDIRQLTKAKSRNPFPATEDLERAVPFEIAYQRALWKSDYPAALESAKRVLAALEDPDLRGYRALWHYLAGSAALLAGKGGNSMMEKVAQEQYNQAMKAAKHLPWASSLLPPEKKDPEVLDVDENLQDQVEKIEATLVRMGTSSDRKFAKAEKKILEGLQETKTFESSQVELGRLLGFTADNNETDAAPDPWWIGKSKGIVFEDHADGESGTVFGAVKARQANGHPAWLRDNVDYASECDILAVIVSPVSKAGDGAFPHLRSVAFWDLDDFRRWAQEALAALRGLKSSLPGAGDMLWRAEAERVLDEKGLSMARLRERLEARMAHDVLERHSAK
ncbi:DEAD/DEAH box helicase [Rhodovulum adriaticum]|nr:DEAD/DEAH box helicase [Rhodovulum adriaticum]MBK1635142.1 hypothetical protein [Rhodovulum adriaticum]